MDENIQAFRQPLVTATGIILGFILNYAANFVKAESTMSDGMAYFIGGCVLLGIVCLIVVLYRILHMYYPKESAQAYYQATLRLFIFGVSIAFAGVVVDMFANFMLD